MPRTSLLVLLLFLCAVPALSQDIPYTPGLDTSVMDRSADPCADFFQFSCGNWLKKNPIPPDQVSWSTYSKMAD